MIPSGTVDIPGTDDLLICQGRLFGGPLPASPAFKRLGLEPNSFDIFLTSGLFDTHFMRWASKHGPNCLIYYVKLGLFRISGQIVTTEPCKSCVFVQLTAICKIESQNQSLSSASYFDSLAVFILIKKLLYKTF